MANNNEGNRGNRGVMAVIEIEEIGNEKFLAFKRELSALAKKYGAAVKGEVRLTETFELP